MNDDDEVDWLLREVASCPSMAPPPVAKSEPEKRASVWRRRRKWLVLSLVLVTLSVVLTVVCWMRLEARRTTSVETTESIDGALDLSARRLPGNPVYLSAQHWSFYWDRFVSDDPRVSRPAPDAWSPLSFWVGVVLRDGTHPSAYGHATYQLRIVLPEAAKDAETELAVHFAGCITACALVIRDADTEPSGWQARADPD